MKASQRRVGKFPRPDIGIVDAGMEAEFGYNAMTVGI